MLIQGFSLKSRRILERPEKEYKATEYFNRPEKQEPLLWLQLQALSISAREQEQGLEERNHNPYGYFLGQISITTSGVLTPTGSFVLTSKTTSAEDEEENAYARSREKNYTLQLQYAARSRAKYQEPYQALGTEAIHTVIDSVLGHAVITTVEHFAAKQSGGALSYSYRIRIVGTGLSALSTLCA